MEINEIANEETTKEKVRIIFCGRYAHFHAGHRKPAPSVNMFAMGVKGTGIAVDARQFPDQRALRGNDYGGSQIKV